MPMLFDIDPFEKWLGIAKDPLDALTLARTYCFVGPKAKSATIEEVVLTLRDAESLLQSFRGCWKSLWGIELGGVRKTPFYAAGFQMLDSTIHFAFFYSFVGVRSPDEFTEELSQREKFEATAPSITSETRTIFKLAEKVLRTSGARECRVPLPLGAPPDYNWLLEDGTKTKKPSFPNLSHECNGETTTIWIKS